jgi:hypothetical protein
MNRRKFCISHIHPAETFPLVLALGIILQGLVFAGAQGTGLSSIFVDGCALTSQFMFPGMFSFRFWEGSSLTGIALLLVPYMLVVFGMECALRSFRSNPFRARGKYDVTICLIVISLMTIGTWIPVHLHPEKDHCFASLMWFVSDIKTLGLILLAVVQVLSFISCITIFWRLSTFTAIDKNQRIAASRMVYYLVVGLVSTVSSHKYLHIRSMLTEKQSFVIPFFITLNLHRESLKTSMMGTVVLNLSGLMTGLLQLFLRTNTAATSFKPKNTPGWGSIKHEVRLWGPNELGFGGHLLQPVSGPDNSSRPQSRASLYSIEKDRAMSLDSLSSPPLMKAKIAYNPLAAHAVSLKSPFTSQKPLPSSMTAVTHARKKSYSLFPTDGGDVSPTKSQVPSVAVTAAAESNENPFLDPPPQVRPAESVYSIRSLLPPPALFSKGIRERRDSSTLSTATVQIGLRLSHAPPYMQQDIPALPATTYSATGNAPSASTLRVQTSQLSPIYTRTPSPLAKASQSSQKDDKMKNLPPTPRRRSKFDRIKSEEVVQLSPTVYSPGKKSPSTPPQQLSPSVYTPEAKKMGLPGSPKPNHSRGPGDDWI